MTSDDLTIRQAGALREQVRGRLLWATELVERCRLQGFPPADPVFREAEGARQKLQDLFNACHYAGCRSGVGKPAKPLPGSGPENPAPDPSASSATRPPAGSP